MIICRAVIEIRNGELEKLHEKLSEYTVNATFLQEAITLPNGFTHFEIHLSCLNDGALVELKRYLYERDDIRLMDFTVDHVVDPHITRGVKMATPNQLHDKPKIAIQSEGSLTNDRRTVQLHGSIITSSPINPSPPTNDTETLQKNPQLKTKENVLNNKIKAILDKKFIQTEKIARILTLAIEGQKNCILWGAAGHGKSEMVAAAIEGLERSDDCFVQSFGEGMSEERLFGGLNFAKLEADGVIEYNADISFLNHKIAVFEEIFDAPAIVLLGLKDTLTAHELRNGHQRYPMQTETIIAITNRAPSEISEIGAAAHALIERFPLQLEVKWDSYQAHEYLEMFQKVIPDAHDTLQGMLAELCQKVHDDGGFISPRSAIHALEVLRVASNGYPTNGQVDSEVFTALEFVPGFERAIEGIAEDIQRKQAKKTAVDAISEIVEMGNQFIGALNATDNPVACLQLYKQIEPLIKRATNLKVPDSMVESRNAVKDKLTNILKAAGQKAINLTPGALPQ